MKHPDRSATSKIEATFNQKEQAEATAQKQRHAARVKSHKSVHTLLVDAKEAVERWNAALEQINQGKNDDVYGAPPRIQLAASCSNYFDALNEINAQAGSQSASQEVSDRRNLAVAIVGVVVGVLGVIFAALTYFGFIPAAK